MPFQQLKNRNEIIKKFKKLKVVLHPLISSPIDFPKESWIKPFTYVLPKEGVRMEYYYALNKFIQKGEIADNSYYMFLTDKDVLEDGFFNKLKSLKTNFALVAMKRGNERTFYPTWRNVGRQGMSGSQLIIKGKYLKNNLFLDTHIADAKFLSALWTNNPHNDFTFIGDAFVLYNYLDHTRWNPDTLWKPA